MRRLAGQAIAVSVPLAAFCVMASALALAHRAAGPAPASPARPAPAASRRAPLPEPAFAAGRSAGWLDGVALSRYADLGPWERATGERPAVVALYTRLSRPFPFYEARAVARSGALPLLQLNPRFTPLREIARGDLDGRLEAWGRSLARLGATVAVSFAHEMNGFWETWDCAHVPPRLFVRAWRHVHDVIGTRRVIWVWNVNKVWNGSCPVRALYPGDRYADWVGIDGYLRSPGSSFRDVFGRTLRVVRAITRHPVILAETGVPRHPGQAAQLGWLFSGARSAGLAGLVYFDSVTRKGDYRPQDNPAALRMFRYEIAAAGREAP